jgi:uncharacterized protein (TIGR02996 family)
MGLFDSMCAESGLIIEDKQRLILIAEVAPERWVPVGLPIKGSNDRGGTMDVPRKLDASMKAAVAFGRRLVYAAEVSRLELGEMLDEIRADGSGARWKDRAVSFALVEGGVFEAIVKAVTKNGATAWKRYAQIGLGQRAPLPNRAAAKKSKARTDATARRLCEAILEAPDEEGPRKVYVDYLLERDDPRGRLLSLLPALKKTSLETLVEIALPVHGAMEPAPDRAALVELVQFLAWGTPLTPTHGEGQFTGWDEVGPHVAHARKKYEGMPELLGAVAANEKAWRARIAELDDDD